MSKEKRKLQQTQEISIKISKKTKQDTTIKSIPKHYLKEHSDCQSCPNKDSLCLFANVEEGNDYGEYWCISCWNWPQEQGEGSCFKCNRRLITTEEEYYQFYALFFPCTSGCKETYLFCRECIFNHDELHEKEE
jgi:hypothetical protein